MPFSAFAPIIGGALSGLGGFFNSGNSWQQRALVDAYNYLRGLSQIGLDRAGEIYFGFPDNAGLLARMFSSADLGETLLRGYLPEIERRLLAADPEAAYRIFSGGLYSPSGQDFSQTIGELATQVFQGGGWTPGQQFLRDVLSPISLGETPEQRALGSAAMNLLGAGGENPFVRSLMSGALSGLGSQGMTPDLRSVSGIGQGLLAAGGATGLTESLGTAGANILAAGGRTPATDVLTEIGLRRYAENALLPTETVLGIAADTAARRIRDQAEAASRRALARGGGPAVISGLQNQAAADFADESARLQAAAIQDALLKQQELKLRQQAAGLEGATAGEQLMQRLLGLGGEFTSAAERAEAANRALGGELALRSRAAGTDLMRNLLEAGISGQSLANQRFGLGGNLAGTLLSSRQGALNTLLGSEEALNRYALGAGDLALRQSFGGLDRALQAGQLELSRRKALMDALLGGLGESRNLGNLYASLYQNPLDLMARTSSDFFRNAFQAGIAAGGAFSGYRPGPSPWSTFFENIGRGVSAYRG